MSDFFPKPKQTDIQKISQPDTHKELLENGFRLEENICTVEMQREWNLVSEIPYDSLTNSGIPINEVIIRYITSKGLNKDSSGIHQLTELDIKNIENGLTNFKLYGRSPLVYRLYELIWGYKNYIVTGNPNDNSLFLRLEYWKTAIQAISEHPLWGVGTGDINQALKVQFAKNNSLLELRWQNRHPHNQYLTIAVSFGLIGLLVFLFSIVYPAFSLRIKNNNFYFITILILMLLSFISEDTLETQVGVSIFSFFYWFFIALGKESS